jgi:hypothetical protein
MRRRCRKLLDDLNEMRGYRKLKEEALDCTLWTEIHTATPLVPSPLASDVEMAIAKLKRYKLSGIDQIPAELIESEGITVHSEVCELLNYICK